MPKKLVSKKLAEMAAEVLTDASLMPFGQHKGHLMQNVPSEYLDWLNGQSWLEEQWPNVSAYIAKSRKAIDQDLRDKDRS
jgi:uncharacterized protein (DUF3820 family)